MRRKHSGVEPDAELQLPGLNQYAARPIRSAQVLSPGAPCSWKPHSPRRAIRSKYGLTWRVFHPIPGPDGKLPLLATAEGGSAQFEFEPGAYFIHVAFGRAGVTTKLTVPRDGPVEKQRMVLEAGGLVLKRGVRHRRAHSLKPAALQHLQRPAKALMTNSQLVVADVKPDTIVEAQYRHLSHSCPNMAR